MSKLISGRAGPVLGIESSIGMHQKLKYESSRLKDGWHPYDAFNFLVTAWHLFEDWTKSDYPAAQCRMKRQRRRLPTTMNLVLDVVRDLVNGSKHFELNSNATGKRRIGAVHSGEEVGFYEYLFHENLPAVTVDNNWYFSIRVLHNILMRYFEWVFDDAVLHDQFPIDLVDALEYCNILNRGSSTPEVWLLEIESVNKNK